MVKGRTRFTSCSSSAVKSGRDGCGSTRPDPRRENDENILLTTRPCSKGGAELRPSAVGYDVPCSLFEIPAGALLPWPFPLEAVHDHIEGRYTFDGLEVG